MLKIQFHFSTLFHRFPHILRRRAIFQSLGHVNYLKSILQHNTLHFHAYKFPIHVLYHLASCLHKYHHRHETIYHDHLLCHFSTHQYILNHLTTFILRILLLSHSPWHPCILLHWRGSSDGRESK